MEYVAGLMFSKDGSDVALVRKNRPKWQEGRLNAIGGKIEAKELPYTAMVREFTEETGVRQTDWTPVAVLTGHGFVVHFYAAFDDKVYGVKTMEDEQIEILSVTAAQTDPALINNLLTIIALSKDTSGLTLPVSLTELPHESSGASAKVESLEHRLDQALSVLVEWDTASGLPASVEALSKKTTLLVERERGYRDL